MEYERKDEFEVVKIHSVYYSNSHKQLKAKLTVRTPGMFNVANEQMRKVPLENLKSVPSKIFIEFFTESYLKSKRVKPSILV